MYGSIQRYKLYASIYYIVYLTKLFENLPSKLFWKLRFRNISKFCEKPRNLEKAIFCVDPVPGLCEIELIYFKAKSYINPSIKCFSTQPYILLYIFRRKKIGILYCQNLHKPFLSSVLSNVYTVKTKY